MRLLLVILLALPAAVGCDNASKNNPNPDLKVPDVPAGNRTQPKAK
jgi:hypothetical protein